MPFRALAQLFDELRMQQDAEFSVRVSYLELYNEEIFDLLSATEDTTRLQLYEDSTKKGSVIIKVGQCVSDPVTFWYGSGSSGIRNSDDRIQMRLRILIFFPILNFCLMMGGSGSIAGSVPLTNGSKFGRPKNVRFQRIRIRNTEVGTRK